LAFKELLWPEILLLTDEGVLIGGIVYQL